jgi:hypothetical protein
VVAKLRLNKESDSDIMEDSGIGVLELVLGLVSAGDENEELAES